MTVKPVVVTFESDARNPGLARLLRSLDKHGWEREVVVDRWRGFGYRLQKVAERFRQIAGKYTHGIHLDSRDTVAFAPPSEFVPPSVPLLLATEKACWPPVPGLQELYPPRESNPYWYAHSQYTLDLNWIDLLQCDGIHPEKDDQLHCHELYLSRHNGIELDRRCEVIQSIAHSKPWQEFFEVDGDRIVNKITGSRPLFGHGNGNTTMTWLPGCN